MTKTIGVSWIAFLAAILTITACGGERTALINGAGATFPYPLYSKWFSEYAKVNTNVNFNYQSIGSGGGIRQIISGTVDFGATDGPMTDEQLAQAPGELLHLPTVLGGDVAVYNVPGVTGSINLSQDALAGIFLGTVKTWNDPAIVSVNEGVALPANPIVVVHRSDGSGTTFIWTDFLSKVSDSWAQQVGKGTSVNWPVGLGGKGNEGVAGLVKQTPYSIGYVELGYAENQKLTHAKIENAAGEYVLCTQETVTKAAAAAAANMPADFRVSITNPQGPGVYPIASFTWLLVYTEQKDAQKGQALTGFLKWMLHEGQQYAGPLGYAPLPPEVVTLEEAAIGKIRVAS